MFDVGDKITMRLKGEPHIGFVRKIKWGLAYIDFEGKHDNGWFEIRRLEKPNAVPDTNRK